MDSVTQFVLGASVAVGVMGRQQPIWKSALAGGLIGTLPDLDVLFSHGDPISDMTRHRAATHAVFWQTVVAPGIGLALALFSRRIDLLLRWWILAWLVLLTHAGLDALTIYGTQLLLPRDPTPYGLGSIFVIDPLYTLTLVAGLTMALLIHGRHGRRWNLAGLLLSSGYLVWGWQVQQHIVEQVMQTPAARGLSADRVLVTPTPFNSVLWRIVLRHPDRYQEGFHSLLDHWRAPDRPIRFVEFPHDEALDAQTRDDRHAESLRSFSRGFYSVQAVGDSLRISDLRMGQAPHYVFSFEYARRLDDAWVSVPNRRVGMRLGDTPLGDWLAWLLVRASGIDREPPR